MTEQISTQKYYFANGREEYMRAKRLITEGGEDRDNGDAHGRT